VSCYRGFHCTPGAEGVGRAATTAFVWSFVLILGIDLFLGNVMYSTYYRMFRMRSSTFRTYARFTCHAPKLHSLTSAPSTSPSAARRCCGI